MLRKRRPRYYGHLSRIEKKRLPKLAMNWVPDSKRPCGRPLRCWLNVIEKDLKVLDPNLDLKAAELIAQINKTNDLILNLTPENMTQHSRIE